MKTKTTQGLLLIALLFAASAVAQSMNETMDDGMMDDGMTKDQMDDGMTNDQMDDGMTNDQMDDGMMDDEMDDGMDDGMKDESDDGISPYVWIIGGVMLAAIAGVIAWRR